MPLTTLDRQRLANTLREAATAIGNEKMDVAGELLPSVGAQIAEANGFRAQIAVEMHPIVPGAKA